MGATGRGRHLAWHNLIDLVRLGIKHFRIDTFLLIYTYVYISVY
jgi:hypothetical protein